MEELFNYFSFSKHLRIRFVLDIASDQWHKKLEIILSIVIERWTFQDRCSFRKLSPKTQGWYKIEALIPSAMFVF
jgi:hypothetical protein